MPHNLHIESTHKTPLGYRVVYVSDDEESHDILITTNQLREFAEDYTEQVIDLPDHNGNHVQQEFKTTVGKLPNH